MAGEEDRRTEERADGRSPNMVDRLWMSGGAHGVTHAPRPRYTSESEQPYKVAGLRFNPKFISSISKGLSRAPSPSE